MPYHIEKNSIQETLIIPLFGRLICSEHYPELFSDPTAARICTMLDYDFSEKRKLMESQAGLFGALEVAQRQYDLMWEVRDYLKTHPKAAVVNLGCGLDDTFSQVDNGECRGCNLDMPDVIAVREASRSTTRFKAIAEGENASMVTPKWLEKDQNLLGGKVVAIPQRDDIDYPVEEHLIVELYSK